MTVPQLLARLQFPAIQWNERKQIVEELRVRPAREVLPLLYQMRDSGVRVLRATCEP